MEHSATTRSRYFNVDGDDDQASLHLHTSSCETVEESNIATTKSALTWRGKPEETNSDCSIVVVTNELESQSYYVHKRIVSKQSKFFYKTFKQRRKKDSKKKRQKMPSVKVELEDRDAKNFPFVLDFIYNNPSSSENGPTSRNSKRGNDNVIGTSSSNTTDPTVSISYSMSVDTLPTLPSMSSLLSSSSFDQHDDDQYIINTKTATTSNNTFDNLTTHNAVSIRYLGRKLEMDNLTKMINRFIQRDLTFLSGPTYLYNAYEYNDDRLMSAAQRLCAENIEQIDKRALLKLPVHLFRIVIRSLETYQEETNQQLSLFLSTIVCKYLERHPKLRSAELLLELTDPLLMPYVKSEAAIGFTAIVKDLDPSDAMNHWDKLLQLCERCAKSVVREYGWSDFSVQAAVTDYLGRGKENNSSTVEAVSCTNAVDSLLFATSFAAALEQAQDDYEDITTAHDNLSKLLTTLNISVAVWERTSQQKDEYIKQQNEALVKSKQEIAMLRRDLGIAQRDLEAAQTTTRDATTTMMTTMRRGAWSSSQSPPQQQHQPFVRYNSNNNTPPLQQQQQHYYSERRDNGGKSEQLQRQPTNNNSSRQQQLVSPAQVVTGADRSNKRHEFQSRNEMRTRSLLV